MAKALKTKMMEILVNYLYIFLFVCRQANSTIYALPSFFLFSKFLWINYDHL